MDKLKPCPFCGGEAKLINQRDYHGYIQSYRITCKTCGALTLETSSSNSKRKAAESWNTRPFEDKARKETINECEKVCHKMSVFKQMYSANEVAEQIAKLKKEV